MEALKFREMPYERPDGEALKTSMRTLTEKLRAAGSYEAAKAVFLEKETLSKHIQTLATLAQVRHTIDTRDKFYDEENGFWNQLSPELEEYSQEWTKAMLASPYRADFEKEYGTLMFLNAEIALKTFSPEIIPELQKENDLTTEYDKLIASAQIPFEGGVYTLSQLSPFKTGADDAQRLAAWKAEGGWYKEHQSELDRIYDELVHLRDTMGKKLGYKGYTELGYYRMGPQLLRQGRCGEVPRRRAQVSCAGRREHLSGTGQASRQNVSAELCGRGALLPQRQPASLRRCRAHSRPRPEIL